MFLREAELANDEELPRFQAAYRLPSGDLPAVWPLESADLEHCSLSVHHEETALAYGRLHYETDTCPDEDQAEQLALLVTKRGYLLPFAKSAH